MKALQPRLEPLLFVCAAVAATLAFPVHASTVMYSDNTFNDSDWSLTLFTRGNGGTIGASQDPSIGNPARSRQVRHVVNSVTGSMPDSVILGFHILSGGPTPATHDPALCPIASVDYSLDYRNPSAGNIGTGLAVLQNGMYYVANTVGGPTGNSFNTLGVTGLTAASFGKVSATTSPIIDFTMNPDFSAAGSPMTFGFLTANSTFSGGYTRNYWIDNWKVTVCCVPEPNSVVLLLTCLCISAIQRR